MIRKGYSQILKYKDNLKITHDRIRSQVPFRTRVVVLSNIWKIAAVYR